MQLQADTFLCNKDWFCSLPYDAQTYKKLQYIRKGYIVSTTQNKCKDKIIQNYINFQDYINFT